MDAISRLLFRLYTLRQIEMGSFTQSFDLSSDG